MISPLKTITRKKEKASVLPQNFPQEDEGIYANHKIRAPRYHFPC